MRSKDVFGVGLLAAATTGALSSLVFLLATGGVPTLTDLFWTLSLWLGYAGWIGIAAGLALGLVPASVAALEWRSLARDLGVERAINCVTVVVAAIVLAEVLVVTSVSDGFDLVPWAVPITALSAVTGWTHLRWARRLAARHPALPA